MLFFNQRVAIFIDGICFRTDQMAAVYARLQAVISTCRKRRLRHAARPLRSPASLLTRRRLGSYSCSHKLLQG